MVAGVLYVVCALTIEIKAIFDPAWGIDGPARVKITTGMRKKTCKGVGQATAYVVGAHGAAGTFLGLCVIGSRFMRILVVDADTVVVELESRKEGDEEDGEVRPALGKMMTASELLFLPDLYDLLPNSLLNPVDRATRSLQEDSVQRLWAFQRLGWQVLTDSLTADDQGRLKRLPPASEAFKQALADLNTELDVGPGEYASIVSAARHARAPDGGGGDEGRDGADEQGEGSDGDDQDEGGDGAFDPDEHEDEDEDEDEDDEGQEDRGDDTARDDDGGDESMGEVDSDDQREAEQDGRAGHGAFRCGIVQAACEANAKLGELLVHRKGNKAEANW